MRTDWGSAAATKTIKGPDNTPWIRCAPSRRQVLHRLVGMRRNHERAALCCAALALTVAGCSSGGPTTASSTVSPQPTSTSELPPLPPQGPTPPDAVGVSPGGVTTRVDVPSDATESQYGQACHTAKLWMNQQGGDPKSLVEPYLQTLQAAGASGPGSFDMPWAQLTPAQQAGVIIAVTGAANGDCE